MTFLAPWFLGLAALIGVPLLVHLLRRHVGRIVDFPAIRYLLRMEKEHSREIKLKHRLLLFLRLLAVLALALAAARPVARLAGLGHAPVALALVVDNSMSTGAVSNGRPLLATLTQDARSLVTSLAAEDRAWIITADGRVTGGAPAALLTHLDGLRPLGGRGDLPAALRRATALARSGSPRAPVVALVTDGQANALGGTSDSAIVVEGIPVVLHAVRAPAPRNRAVLAATATPPRWAPAGAVSFAIASADTVAWRIALEGRTVARGDAEPGDVYHPATVTTRLSSTSMGWLRGSVEVDADELRGDDVRHFAVRIAPPPSVDVRSEAGPFVAAAVSTLVDDGRLARLGSTDAAGAPSARVTVTGAESPGGSRPILLFAPSDPVRVADANRTLARLRIPWRFGIVARDTVQVRRRGFANAQSAAVPASVTPATSQSAAAMSAMLDPDAALQGIRVALRYPLMPATGAAPDSTTPGGSAHPDTLAYAAGTPWIVAGAGYVLVASPMFPTASELPLRAGFVPWVLDVVARRLGDDGRLLQAAPGSQVKRPDDVTALELPDGSTRPLSGSIIAVPAEDGVYLLRRGAARVGALVVNAEAEESNLTPAADSTLLKRFTGRTLSAAPDAHAWRNAVLEQATGRPLLLPLVALALIALLLEAWLSRVHAGAGEVTLRAGSPAPSRAA